MDSSSDARAGTSRESVQQQQQQRSEDDRSQGGRMPL